MGITNTRPTIIGSIKKPLFLKKPTNKKFVIWVIVAVVVIGGCFLLSKHSTRNDKKAFSVAVAKSNQLKSKGDHNGVKHVWEDYLATKPKNKEIRANAEFYLAQADFNLSDYPNAQKYGALAVADTASPGYNMYLFMGDVAKVQKDYKSAADYYQKAYDKLKAAAQQNPVIRGAANYAQYNAQQMKAMLNQGQTNSGQ